MRSRTVVRWALYGLAVGLLAAGGWLLAAGDHATAAAVAAAGTGVAVIGTAPGRGCRRAAAC